MSVLPTFAGFPGGDLVLRSSGGTDEEVTRIAELEREVAGLREQLEEATADEEGER